MNKLLKTKWIEALLSGNYRQIKTRLTNRGKGRCCLGVLMDVAGFKKTRAYDNIGYKADNYGNIEFASLTYDFILSNDIKFISVHKLIDMNDKENKSFEEIASYIESNM